MVSGICLDVAAKRNPDITPDPPFTILIGWPYRLKTSRIFLVTFVTSVRQYGEYRQIQPYEYSQDAAKQQQESARSG